MGASLSRERLSLAGKHVLITGGSEGIGLALAKECVQKDAYVTILARTTSKLEKAATELRALVGSSPRSPRANVNCCSADVTDASQVAAALSSVQEKHGSIDMLFCVAGKSYPGSFLDQDVAVAQQTMQLNYFGTHNVLKAVIPQMVARNSGHAVLVSSAAALVSHTGYSSYTPSKCAVRGLADCLRNELCYTNVKISIAYPPDTDTPGYEAEQKLKPVGCEEVSRALGSQLVSPEQVASCLLKSLLKGHYHLASPDFGQNLLMSHMAGITPRPHLWLQFLLGAILPLVTTFLLRVMDSTVRRIQLRPAASQKAQQAQSSPGISTGLLETRQ